MDTRTPSNVIADTTSAVAARHRNGGWFAVMLVFASMGLLPFAIVALVLWYP